MNSRAISHILGRIFIVGGLLMLLPLAIVFIYHEPLRNLLSFVLPAAVLLISGYILTYRRSTPITSLAIYTKESMLIVSLCWLIMSFVGSWPFIISEAIPSWIDAFFETVSGFTTTGASILTNVEALSHSLLFWRSFTHFIGGMGILVFVLAALPRVDRRASKIMSAEVPGPTFGKIVPKLSFTARILYALYFIFFVVLVVCLVLAKMPLFDAILHAFGTAGTGGFGMKSNSVAYYQSPVIDYILSIGMIVFGVNFNLYFLSLIQRDRKAFKNHEFKAYLMIIAAATLVITLVILPQLSSLEEAFRQALFTVSSIMTTTGFSISDFDQWPNLAKLILLLLMFIGGCAGSTAGGLKVSRITMLWETFKSNLKRIIHPHQVAIVTMDHKRIEESWLLSVKNYFITYMFLYVLILILVAPSSPDLETTISAVTTTYNNVGPGFKAVGPMSSFADMSTWNKLVLSFAMLFGRLEIYPLLLLFTHNTWKRV